jgi:hypothetical protein
MTPEEHIKMYEREETKSANFRSLYQDVADLIFPHENQITNIDYPGREKTTDLFDETGMTAREEMASGLSVNLFPPGQRFYNIVMSDRRLNDIEVVRGRQTNSWYDN